ncbi:hypothetical protein V7122_01595 [Bacillus sp. JJ1532]|uniref:hypothetical protein n=1 Tax=Bacillus sp. JJ1532 TaxID=3122958 RepID=UPI002FFE2823
MIEITDVYFVNSEDPDFSPEIESGVMLIDNRFALDIYPNECIFRTVTGELNGLPVVDLSICKHLRIIETEIDKNEVNWLELMQMPFVNVIEKLAK